MKRGVISNVPVVGSGLCIVDSLLGVVTGVVVASTCTGP